MTYPQSGRRIGVRRAKLYESSGLLYRPPLYSDLIHANQPEIVTIGTGVTSWPDQIVSANELDWAQLTAANQPAWGLFTTKPALVFDGVNDRMTAPALPAMNVMTLAFSCVTAGGSKTIFETSPVSGVGNPGSILIYENGGNLNFDYYRTGTTSKAYTVGAGQTLRVVIVLNPNTSGPNCWPTLYVNGASAGAYTSITAVAGQIGSYAWGMGSTNAPAFFWNGKLGDVWMYGRALTVPEILAVDAALATRCT